MYRVELFAIGCIGLKILHKSEAVTKTLGARLCVPTYHNLLCQEVAAVELGMRVLTDRYGLPRHLDSLARQDSPELGYDFEKVLPRLPGDGVHCGRDGFLQIKAILLQLRVFGGG